MGNSAHDPRSRGTPTGIRRLGRWLAALTVLTALALAGVASADHGDPYINLTVADEIVEHDGAVFIQGGIGAGTGNYDPFLQVHADPTERGYNTEPVGNGQFDTKSISAGNTHKVLASAVPQVTYDGVLYREFGLDANDVGADPYMSVDEIKVFLDDQFALTDYDQAGETFANDTAPAAHKVYDLDANSDTAILIESQTLEPGSGVSDITLLLPAALFPEECDYGSLDCEEYLIFWTVMGELAGDPTGMDRNWDTSDGFEEWQFSKQPVVAVSKTANVSLTRTHSWDITKTVAPDAHDGFVGGDAGTSTWTVVVDETEVDSDTTVSGTIEITNPTDPDLGIFDDGVNAVIESIEDVINVDGGSDTPANVTCPVTLPYTLSPGEVLTCTYSEVVDPGDGTGTNTATVDISDGLEFAATYGDTADFDFADATITHDGPQEVTVDDDRDTEGNFPDTISGDATYDYDEDFSCSSDPADYTDGVDVDQYDNTATLADDDGVFDSDDASVTVTCYLPSISKTAAGTYDERHEWDVTKTVDPTSQAAFAGDTVDFDWTITVGEDVFEENFDVAGTITVDNPNPEDALVVALSDTLSDGTPVTITDGTCNYDADTGLLTVAAGGSEVCGYTANDLPYDDVDLAPDSNDATITLNGIDFDASDPIEYDANVIRGTATLDDDQYPFEGEAVTDGWTATYGDTYTCSTNPDDYTDGSDLDNEVSNTADVYSDGELQDSSTATTEIDCYIPSISKTADTSFTRTYNWLIDKDALLADGTSVPAEGLMLNFGQAYDLEWEITVDLDPAGAFTDTAHAIDGVVTVTNPAPGDGPDMTVDVTDVFTPDGGADVPIAVDCDPAADGDQHTGIVLSGGESVDCTYHLDTDGTDGTNVATATLDTGASDSGSADVDFSDAAADITEVNATIVVTDTFQGGTETELGTAHWTEAPKTFTVFTLLSSDPTDLPDLLLECGEQTVTNRTDMYNHDGDVYGANLGFDVRDVLVDVTCFQGCTLTLGYWKTHNDSFWGGAPSDETWMLIGDQDDDGVEEYEEEEFFHSGQTWFEVFWTPNKGGNAYYQLAHQWMAAYLNTLAGADPTAAQDALDFGWTFFDNPSNTPDGNFKGKDGKALRTYASTLDDYNNGLIGPGHCDEDYHSNAS